MGTFDVSDNPPATVFIDDVKISEPDSGNTSTAFNVSLSKAQSSSVTFDYSINGTSTQAQMITHHFKLHSHYSSRPNISNYIS